MANIVNGKLDHYLDDEKSINIGNGYKIQAQCKENYSNFTPIDELGDYDVFSELSSLPEGVTFRRLNTRSGEIAFVLDNANKMLDDFGTPDEKREETIEKYFQEARDYFLERFGYIDSKIVIVAPNGEVIEPDYDDEDRPLLRSDDTAGILAAQNNDIEFIENNIDGIIKGHYESKIKSAENALEDAERKLKIFENNTNDFSFGKKAPSGPGM